MRYLRAALIVSVSACTEPERHALGPIGDTDRHDATQFAADTIIDYGARPGVAPHLVSQQAFPQPTGLRKGSYYIVVSFVIDTAGSVVRNSVRIENEMPSELAAACQDWLRGARFEPIQRAGRPVRAALRNMMASYIVR